MLTRDRDLLKGEIELMLASGAIMKVHLHKAQSGYHLTMLVIPKKDGRIRPVFNLKNSVCQFHHFKMEGTHTVEK